jgi:hypothetical protein
MVQYIRAREVARVLLAINLVDSPRMPSHIAAVSASQCAPAAVPYSYPLYILDHILLVPKQADDTRGDHLMIIR